MGLPLEQEHSDSRVEHSLLILKIDYTVILTSKRMLEFFKRKNGQKMINSKGKYFVYHNNSFIKYSKQSLLKILLVQVQNISNKNLVLSPVDG